MENNRICQKVDELIKKEKLAIASYDVAIQRIDNKENKSLLKTYRDDHANAITVLERYGSRTPFVNSKKTTMWEKFTNIFSNDSGMYGASGSLKSLKSGEEQGIEEYRYALHSSEIPDELKKVIKNELLPNKQRHLTGLNSIDF